MFRSVRSSLCPVCTPTPCDPSPVFSQVFILKGVKVLCFDTLLQVFILKVLADARFASWAARRWAFLRRIRDTPTPGGFAERVWIYLIAKELSFLGATKSPERCVGKGVSSAGRMLGKVIRFANIADGTNKYTDCQVFFA